MHSSLFLVGFFPAWQFLAESRGVIKLVTFRSGKRRLHRERVIILFCLIASDGLSSNLNLVILTNGLNHQLSALRTRGIKPQLFFRSFICLPCSPNLPMDGKAWTRIFLLGNADYYIFILTGSTYFLPPCQRGERKTLEFEPDTGVRAFDLLTWIIWHWPSLRNSSSSWPIPCLELVAPASGGPKQLPATGFKFAGA